MADQGRPPFLDGRKALLCRALGRFEYIDRKERTYRKTMGWISGRAIPTL